MGHRATAFVPELKSHGKAHQAQRSPFTAIVAFFRRLVASVARANQRKVLYQQLNTLDDRLLADIGIRRTDIPRLVAESYRADAGTSRAAATGTRPDPLMVEEDLAVADIVANDVEARRVA